MSHRSRIPPALILAPAALAVVAVLVACSGSKAHPVATATIASTPTASVAACAPARPHAPGDVTDTIQSGGTTRSYILHVPPGYDGTHAVPIVFDFHGAGSNKEQQAFYSTLSPKADAEGFIIITPDGAGTPRQWNFLGIKSAADDTGLVRDLLDHAESTLCIDATRVYAMGISSGGAMSMSLACSMQDRFTAIASVAALFRLPNCPDTRPVPIIEFHGDADPLVPFHGGPVGGLPSPDIEHAAADWAKADGCAAAPATTQVTPHVKLESYDGCQGGVAVRLYVVAGGGHTWPGARIDVNLLGLPLGATTHEIDATDIIWQFFASEPRLNTAH
jgi:polyhydroxybutyrate depolymerase